jgi:hypothetical protein
MTQNADQIRAALEAHEHLAPDATEVSTRAKEMARSYRRRRVATQGAGGAVLSLGLVAGGLNLPGLFHGGQAQTTTISAAAGGVPAVTPPVSPKEVKRALAAYFGAGYGLENAKQLAKIWKMSSKPSELTAVKAEAGRRLLAHEPIPVKPEAPDTTDPKDLAATAAFFNAGYSVADAQKLAKLWKLDDAYAAKVAGGKKLEAGEKLPIKPSPAGIADAEDAAALEAYFAAGYGYDDAVKLAKLWKIKTASEAKVAAGEKLLDGKKLPIKPSSSPTNGEDKDTAATEAFFKAGYDYADAVTLAKLWHTAGPYEAKVLGGQKLLAGKKLPIKP